LRLNNLLIAPTISPKDGHEKEPFKTIRQKFINYLEIADVCIVIGFSFRDKKVAEPFLSKAICLITLVFLRSKIIVIPLLSSCCIEQTSSMFIGIKDTLLLQLGQVLTLHLPIAVIAKFQYHFWKCFSTNP